MKFTACLVMVAGAEKMPDADYGFKAQPNERSAAVRSGDRSRRRRHVLAEWAKTKGVPMMTRSRP